MSYSLILHVAAKTDYEEAYEWYEAQQVGLGERFMVAFRKLADAIILHPERYGTRVHKKYREARLKKFPYSIIYTIYKDKQIVFVSSVHHHKRHPRSKYRKM